ncbi:hypothetical protein [Parapedobacter tibetensis]|uniref:hypothetical protein n=1 Tax=Parapedobacter tibetensis TaxID=2972951 RepID=UPI00214D627E|nr:hypothetical protein [Parapedobacter tibetensis]
MKKVRITPLNIASALLLTWLLWQIIDDKIGISGIGWFLLFLLILVAADQFFRLMLRNLKRVWIAEGIFVVLVAVVIWILKIW